MTLTDVIDLHVHSSPDVRVRSVDDWGIVTSAAEHGMKAVVIKNHFFPTMCRAADVQRVSDKVKVFGGIALNYPVGGLNPHAVEKAIALGAKIIWLPTHDAANHYRKFGKSGGISIERGTAEASLAEDIVELSAQHDIILATGHLSPSEIKFIADLAVKHGVKKFLITHPELHIVNLSLGDQRQLIGAGAYFERVYAQPVTPGHYHVNLEDNYQAIQELGYETTVISTDGGQVENPFWTDALLEYLNYLEKRGIPQEALDRMSKVNPAKLLGL